MAGYNRYNMRVGMVDNTGGKIMGNRHVFKFEGRGTPRKRICHHCDCNLEITKGEWVFSNRVQGIKTNIYHLLCAHEMNLVTDKEYRLKRLLE